MRPKFQLLSFSGLSGQSQFKKSTVMTDLGAQAPTPWHRSSRQLPAKLTSALSNMSMHNPHLVYDRHQTVLELSLIVICVFTVVLKSVVLSWGSSAYTPFSACAETRQGCSKTVYFEVTRTQKQTTNVNIDDTVKQDVFAFGTKRFDVGTTTTWSTIQIW